MKRREDVEDDVKTKTSTITRLGINGNATSTANNDDFNNDLVVNNVNENLITSTSSAYSEVNYNIKERKKKPNIIIPSNDATFTFPSLLLSSSNNGDDSYTSSSSDKEGTNLSQTEDEANDSTFTQQQLVEGFSSLQHETKMNKEDKNKTNNQITDKTNNTSTKARNNCSNSEQSDDILKNNLLEEENILQYPCSPIRNNSSMPLTTIPTSTKTLLMSDYLIKNHDEDQRNNVNNSHIYLEESNIYESSSNNCTSSTNHFVHVDNILNGSINNNGNNNLMDGTSFNGRNNNYLDGDVAMKWNEKIHQFLLPICFFLCYFYLIFYSTDYMFWMSVICLLTIGLNLNQFKQFVQEYVAVWLLKRSNNGLLQAFSDCNCGEEKTVTSNNTDNNPTSNSINSGYNGVNNNNSGGSTIFYSSINFARLYGGDERSSSVSSDTSFNVTSSADKSRQLQLKLIEVYTCKVMIALNILLYFIRLILCTKDPTVGWLMIGFLSSTIHNYSYIILQNAMVDCNIHSFEITLWAIIPHHLLSIGTGLILTFEFQRYVEAFGTCCMLIVLNFIMNSISYKLMNRLNTMKLMTSKLKEANRSKNALVSSISHEFRSPLMSISGAIELLLDTKLNGEQSQYIKTIGSCSSILLTLVEDILQYSKLEKTNLEIATNSMLSKTANEGEKDAVYRVFSLYDCLEHVKSITSSYASSFDVNIEFVISENIPPFVLGESVRIQQVLINILTNAIKASPANQVVTLKVDASEEGNELSTTATVDEKGRHLKEVIFKIIDHGNGIPEHIQKLLFKPFCTSSPGITNGVVGTGLGLSIAKRIITNMKGTISYTTCCVPPDNGTTFSVCIPFILPDQKKKNSLKHIEEILKHHPILSTEKKLIQVDEAIQRNHLLHKELYNLRRASPSARGSRGSGSSGGSSKSFPGGDITPESPIRMPLEINQKDDERMKLIESTNILLAEDNNINLAVLKRLLEKGGFKNITTCSNGAELVESFKKQYHNIIVTDLHMPVMNGIEAANIIRTLEGGDKTKIILLTADALMDKFNNMDSIDSCLNKPISGDNLNQAILVAVRQQQENEEESF
ncbi:hypothetical protein ABK040_014271 [Willaertia magna]